MTDIICTYTGDRDEALVGYLYEEMDAAERAAFDAHLPTCARCRSELAALGGVRHQLARWNPPEPKLPPSAISHPASAIRGDVRWWQQVPAWAQVAAALLVLGVSAGAANLHVRYDSGGLSVTTGWMTPQAQPTAAVTTEPAGRLQNAATRDDLAALERQLRSEMRGQPSAQARTVSDADVKRLVRPLLDESEKREQRELALRIAEMLRDVSAQHQADLVNIDRNLGFIRNNTLNVDQRQRDLQNYVLRVSQQK